MNWQSRKPAGKKQLVGMILEAHRVSLQLNKDATTAERVQWLDVRTAGGAAAAPEPHGPHCAKGRRIATNSATLK